MYVCDVLQVRAALGFTSSVLPVHVTRIIRNTGVSAAVLPARQRRETPTSAQGQVQNGASKFCTGKSDQCLFFSVCTALAT